jgi:hypothetical protein
MNEEKNDKAALTGFFFKGEDIVLSSRIGEESSVAALIKPAN